MDAAREFPREQSIVPPPLGVPGEILSVLRLAFMLRFDGARIFGRDGTIALLGVAALTVWAVLGRLGNDDALKFEASGIPGLAAVAAAALCLAWLMARLSHPPLAVRRSLWLVAGYLPAVSVVGWLLAKNMPDGWRVLVASVAITHAALYFSFGLHRLGAGRVWRPITALAAGIAALIALNQHLRVAPDIWSPWESPEQVANYLESERRTEQLMYAQPERIDAALAGLAAGPADAANVYFVGFAGFGTQKVFAEEIALAARRIGERYRIEGRRVLLVNDRRDYDRHPLASSTALARTLAGIGAHMNRERDVLILAFASHGKKNPHLVVENGALPLDELTPAALASMLRDSQIRWKVLIISACYSGAFIEHLRDPHTAIFTAAAPDRTSFGCNDRRALTYFGEAFYRDALPQAASLRAGFDSAVAAIVERELAEGLEPSRPQAYFGAAIEGKLAELEAGRRIGVNALSLAGELHSQ